MIRVPLELGNPALRQPAAPVADALAPDVQTLITDLRDTLGAWRAHNGWGRALSASTIGVPLRVALIAYGDVDLVLINPRWERWSSRQCNGWESCICFPALWGSVSRPESVVITALDAAGQARRLEATDDLARILQHELDHLDGLVWLDREPDLTTLCTTAEYRRRHKPQK